MVVKTILMRNREVCAQLGIDRQMIVKMVKCGSLTPVHILPGGRAHYRRSEVDKLTGDQNVGTS